MHEQIIAERIIEEAEKQGAEKKIVLEVGELCDIEDHEIVEALKGLTDWEIEVVERKSEIECRCGYKGGAKILDRGHGYCIYQCPECENIKPKVLLGGQIKLIGVE